MLNETFTTHILFSNRTSHVEAPVDLAGVQSAITRLCDGPAAVMGMIHEVKIVDSLDRVCVHIIGRDIVFPRELGQKQKSFRAASKVEKAKTVQNAIIAMSADQTKPANLYI